MNQGCLTYTFYEIKVLQAYESYDIIISIILYIRDQKPMACKPDVALLITASDSFVAKHKLPHIKEKDLCTDFKSEDPFLRDYYGFKMKIKKSESDSR